jgi:hypothetical protein
MEDARRTGLCDARRVVRYAFPTLALFLGAAFGFLSLETAGVALLLAVVVGGLLWRSEGGWIWAAITSFGTGYLAAVCYFLVGTSGLLSGSFGGGLLAYWAVQVLIGVAIVALGVWARGRRGRAVRT